MKRFVLMVALAVLVSVTFVPVAFAANSSSNRPPNWTVYQETLASREVWYAYGRADVRQYEAIEVGDKIVLSTKSGSIEAKITEILTPLAASDSRSPTRMWIKFESSEEVPSDIGVIFKRWGPF